MDYLDPQKEFRHRILLLVGYICLAVAITMAALVLLYQAYGFGIGKHGQVIQNGLTFFSSQPNPADIYVNGQLQSVRTNTRLVLPEGTYHVKLTRTGYRDWQRTIQLDGGTVEHFDYPLLVPVNLPTKKLADYDSKPSLVTQSPDRRWLLLGDAAAPLNLSVYDLKNPTKAPTTLALPDSLLSDSSAGGSWQLVAWADDNQHILLKRQYDSGKIEYVLVDRTDGPASINLTSSQNVTQPVVSLRDLKYNQYYLYDPTSGDLQLLNQGASGPTSLLQHVLAYKSYGSDTVLYITDSGAPKGKVLLKMLTGGTTYTLRNFDAGSPYLLDLTTYNGTLYVAAGSSAQNKVYVYEDPLGQLQNNPDHALTPIQVLHVNQPNYLDFSTNAQYIMAENGQQFAVYDIENQNGYNYTAHQPLDSPQPHAVWMDGNRLTYISGGKQLIFDYDYTNQQFLSAADASFSPAFAPDFTYIYTVTPDAAKAQLLQTSLLTTADRP